MASSFVGQFIEYLKTRTDAPPDFHIHAAMAALSYTLGSKVWCEGWGRPIYPNLWIVVIAKSGYGKSVPLDLSRAIVEKAQLGDGILPSSFSQEALYSQLVKTPSAIWYLQEFSAFMHLLQRDYNAGSIAWLTEIFDVPSVDKRILRTETLELHRPCITILGASSPDWFAESFKASMLRGGFLARFLFCPSNTAGTYVGFPGPRDYEGVETGLAGWLRDVAQMQGPADISHVRKRFNEWDRASRERLRENCPPEFSGMRSRAGVMVLKAAVLFHVSTNTDDLVITDRDLSNAITYVEKAHLQAEKYLSEEVATDRYEVHRLKLLEVVARNDGHVGWSQAMKNSHLTARDFKEAVNTLIESDRLVIEKGPGTSRGYLTFPLKMQHLNGLLAGRVR